MVLIRKAQFWSMDAIIAVVVFMVAFVLVLGIIVELGEGDVRVDLQTQGATIQTVLAADRPVSFLDGVDIDADRLALFTAIPYDDLRDELGIDGDFCIYFEDEDGNIIPVPSTGGTAPGVGHPDIIVGGGECETEFGVCEDLDGDGYGDGPDCIDADPDPADGDVTPETVDDWCDGVDNDGDGDIDEDARPLEGTSCGLSTGICSTGTWSCTGASGMECSGSTPPRPEVCNSADDDCDGTVDDGCSACVDNDVDGHEAAYCGGDDCDDSSAGVNPSAPERCGDGIDNNCDGTRDEGCLPACRDDDGDGHQAASCGGDDCNDLDSRIFPGAAEVCDDGLDNDCDGSIDLADADCITCTDADADGHFTTVSNPSCGPNDDCDDSDPAAYPGAPETGAAPCKDYNCDDAIACIAPPSCTANEIGMCSNSIDDDCDGSMDCMDSDCSADSACRLSCTDSDGDGYAVEGGACGRVDCDDTRASIYPGARERCGDGIDQDCNGADLIADNDGDRDYDWNLCTNGRDCDDNEARIYSGEGLGGEDSINWCDASGNPWCSGGRCVLCSTQLDDDCDYYSSEPGCTTPGSCETLYCSNPPYCR